MPLTVDNNVEMWLEKHSCVSASVEYFAGFSIVTLICGPNFPDFGQLRPILVDFGRFRRSGAEYDHVGLRATINLPHSSSGCPEQPLIVATYVDHSGVTNCCNNMFNISGVPYFRPMLPLCEGHPTLDTPRRDGVTTLFTDGSTS